MIDWARTRSMAGKRTASVATLAATCALVISCGTESSASRGILEDARLPIVVHEKLGTVRVAEGPSLEIGIGNGDSDVTFGYPASIAIDRHGNIYVLDAMVPQVSVFDSLGVFVRKIGRNGAGPGEYLQPIGLLLRDDSPWSLQMQDEGKC